MATVKVHLPDEMSHRLARLSARTGKSEDSLLVEALEEHLSELEGLEVAEERLAAHRTGQTGSITQAEMESRYGVED